MTDNFVTLDSPKISLISLWNDSAPYGGALSPGSSAKSGGASCGWKARRDHYLVERPSARHRDELRNRFRRCGTWQRRLCHTECHLSGHQKLELAQSSSSGDHTHLRWLDRPVGALSRWLISKAPKYGFRLQMQSCERIVACISESVYTSCRLAGACMKKVHGGFWDSGGSDWSLISCFKSSFLEAWLEEAASIKNNGLSLSDIYPYVSKEAGWGSWGRLKET